MAVKIYYSTLVRKDQAYCHSKFFFTLPLTLPTNKLELLTLANRVTRCFCEKITQKTTKNRPKSHFAQIIGRFFLEKNLPNAIKNCPNGEISPNLVTLLANLLQPSQMFLGRLTLRRHTNTPLVYKYGLPRTNIRPY
jgi:hypothetical protein